MSLSATTGSSALVRRSRSRNGFGLSPGRCRPSASRDRFSASLFHYTHSSPYVIVLLRCVTAVVRARWKWQVDDGSWYTMRGAGARSVRGGADASAGGAGSQAANGVLFIDRRPPVPSGCYPLGDFVPSEVANFTDETAFVWSGPSCDGRVRATVKPGEMMNRAPSRSLFIA